MRLKTLLLAILIFIFLFESSQSYTLLGYRWPTYTFQYYVNPSNADVSDRIAVVAIKKGARVWSPWCRPIYAGVTSEKSVRNDGKNTVFFRSRIYGAIASTYIFHEGDKILDVDIVFWDKAWKFYSGKSGCVDGFYITDVAAHEFGHAIGLGHSHVPETTMYRHTSFCNNATRTLEYDDMEAAIQLYGIGNAFGVPSTPQPKRELLDGRDSH